MEWPIDARAMRQWFQNRIGYVVAVLLMALATAITFPTYSWLDIVFGAMMTLLIVLFVSIRYGMGPALLAAILSSLYLNYFFVPPILEINFPGRHDIVALAAFVIMAVVVGRLSRSAQQRAVEAERGREEIERLYGELKLAFEKTSHLEAVKRSEQMKSALLDAVTHDLRTPLTAIKAAATTLLTNVTGLSSTPILSPENRRDLIQVVIEETDRLNSFVEELLVFARIQGGGVDTIESPGSVEDVVAAATQRANSILKPFRMTINVPEPDLQVANPRIAAQSLFSLLDNAAKYSPAGSQITVTAEAGEGHALFTVDDEGPGILAEDRDMIFSRFYRRRELSSTAPPGLGMGLAIARGLVEAIGGHISVAEKSGPGARFEFSIPLAKPAVEQEHHVETADQDSRR